MKKAISDGWFFSGLFHFSFPKRTDGKLSGLFPTMDYGYQNQAPQVPGLQTVWDGQFRGKPSVWFPASHPVARIGGAGFLGDVGSSGLQADLPSLQELSFGHKFNAALEPLPRLQALTLGCSTAPAESGGFPPPFLLGHV